MTLRWAVGFEGQGPQLADTGKESESPPVVLGDDIGEGKARHYTLERDRASRGGGSAGVIRTVLSGLGVGLVLYAATGAYVARRIRLASKRDDPDHELDAHAFMSIVMCWPHDVQSLLG